MAPHLCPTAASLLVALLAGLAHLPRGAVQSTPAPHPGAAESGDPRNAYDVLAYWLDLKVDPEQQRISGSVTVEVRVLEPALSAFVLDMADNLEVSAVARFCTPLSTQPDRAAAGERSPLAFRHADDRLTCTLTAPAAAGELLTVSVHYGGAPRALNSFDGFHWGKTPDGAPWIATSCQTLGAFTWWPCKANFFDPADKPERLFVDLTVPTGLVGVSNGRLVERSAVGAQEQRFRWRHDYPLETYTVTLNVAPYVEIAGTLELPGIDRPVPYQYFVLAEDEAKARLQFAEVPDILEAFSLAFGPWPFPESKIGLVHTPFWGMEHSTAIAYGSSFPAWIAEHGGEDRYAARNRWFDYILVHELAHEWWGNAVSADDWGDFWIHEGFASYAEGVYVEARQGREAADRFFAEVERTVPRRGSLYRGSGKTSAAAYSGILYGKGAMVLNTLRHFMDDDELWWRCLRDFNLRFRYGNAGTAEFQAVLEEVTGRPWGRFMAEWIHGSGTPSVKGTFTAEGKTLILAVHNKPEGAEGFQLPIDLAWREGGSERKRRLWLEPGPARIEIVCESPPSDLRVLHLERVLGKHDVRSP